MKNLSIFVDRVEESKNNSIEVNLTVVWESGAMCRKVKLDEDFLTELLHKDSIDARQLMICKVFGEGTT